MILKEYTNKRYVLTALSILVGLVIVLYLGLWFCFVGGISQIVTGWNLVNGVSVAIGIFRILCTGFVCWIGVLLTYVAIETVSITYPEEDEINA